MDGQKGGRAKFFKGQAGGQCDGSQEADLQEVLWCHQAQQQLLVPLHEYDDGKAKESSSAREPLCLLYILKEWNFLRLQCCYKSVLVRMIKCVVNYWLCITQGKIECISSSGVFLLFC